MGTLVHVVNRGAHKMPIVRDEADRWRFLKLLRYLNDMNVPQHWERDITPQYIRDNFARPDTWPAAKPFVSILSHHLADNHFHLLVRENVEGGIAAFMHRASRSMAAHYNAKYQSSGALFQGSYRARIVNDDTYLQYLSVYINIKNPFELFPGGLDVSVKNFDQAYEFAIKYTFSSTSDFAGKRESSIIDTKLRKELFQSPQDFRESAKDLMTSRQDFLDFEL